MPRATSSVPRKKRHKKVLKQAKGLLYNYRHRRQKKGVFRKLWIARINAASRINGTSYSKLIASLKLNNIEINRKILSDLAIREPQAFAEIVKVAKAS